ncbi:RidA family protein [Candidatus Frankia alpina]|uniref:RidA family protein n=1 Tax=Candidatus Frankia alpina TaxID=2699483 RepID=UPI0013CFB838|nr:RidA family protein [Candidatus Frankia alpina]
MITRVPGQLPSISGAACHGDLVVTSGVICPDLLLPGMTPATTPDIRRQLDGALQALRDVLREAGSDLQYALRVEAYLARPDHAGDRFRAPRRARRTPGDRRPRPRGGADAVTAGRAAGEDCRDGGSQQSHPDQADRSGA